MDISLDHLFKLPRDSFYVTLEGKLIYDLSVLKETDHFKVHVRVLGGKGGFGSLLRSFGSQFYKSTNQDMCRDLSGRRLKDVKEEEKLKKYIAKAAQREQEKQRKLDEKYKKLKQLEVRKHEFNDTEYNRQREKILEETEQALQEGLKAMAESDAGTSGATSVVLGKRKRSDDKSTSSSTETSSDDKSSNDNPKPKKAKKAIAGDLWLGIDGLNESDLESSDSETEDKSAEGKST